MFETQNVFQIEVLRTQNMKFFQAYVGKVNDNDAAHGSLILQQQSLYPMFELLQPVLVPWTKKNRILNPLQSFRKQAIGDLLAQFVRVYVYIITNQIRHAIQI